MEQNNDNVHTRRIGDWVIKQRTPSGEGPHPVMVMIHGWTGDEDSMWIFASRLPEHAMLIAPRGLHEASYAGNQGYSWEPRTGERWSSMEDFKPAIGKLLDLLTNENFPEADFSNLHLVGFSQGAALSYALGLLHPDKVISIAGLSGFLPEGAEEYTGDQPLQGKKVFITHGTRDSIVPVAKARRAVEVLEEAGAEVVYCEHDTGHKLNADCFRALAEFYKQEQTV